MMTQQIPEHIKVKIEKINRAGMLLDIIEAVVGGIVAILFLLGVIAMTVFLKAAAGLFLFDKIVMFTYGMYLNFLG